MADAQGNFSIKVKMSDGINQFDLQAVDPYGQQTLRAFPILWRVSPSTRAQIPRMTEDRDCRARRSGIPARDNSRSEVTIVGFRHERAIIYQAEA